VEKAGWQQEIAAVGDKPKQKTTTTKGTNTNTKGTSTASKPRAGGASSGLKAMIAA
jgi:hypothetical protein